MNYPWLQQAIQQFNQQLLAGRQAHALLLSGPAGLGKLQLAGEMAAALLCLQPVGELEAGQASLACGECRSCQLFRSGAHPDFRRVTFIPKEKSEELRTVIGVDQVRDLIASMQLTNGLSPRKVALIHPAEAMNRSAANALLKTLEEPLGEGVLLLVSHDATRLPATIRSRCQTLSVRPPALDEASPWLQQFAGVSAEDAALALQAAANSPMRAVLLLQQGRVQEFRKLLQQLQRLSRDSDQVSAAYAELSGLDPNELWHWLSIASAEKMRSAVLADGPAALQTAGGNEANSRQRQYAGLYHLANLNRRLLVTPVRKDLLLRDWLIQWASPTSS
jgi:DNA polymerase-3 subunit delta'